MKRTTCIAAALLFIAAPVHSRTNELQARSYIQSAFITGAAHAIISPDVALGRELRERLALPAQSDRNLIYEAMFKLTEEKTLRVRKATAAEAAAVGAFAGGRPVYALEGGAVPLAVVYDLDRDAIPFVAVLGVSQTPPASKAVAPEAKALRVAESAPIQASAPVPMTITFKPIGFAFNDAALSGEARAELERQGMPKVVDIRDVRYVVHGHADRLGSVDYNQRLSERRAETVRQYLVGKGVPADHIEAIGLGTSAPQTSCTMKNRRQLIECLAPDRRVTIEVVPAL